MSLPSPRPYVVCVAHHPRPDLIGGRALLLPGQHLHLGRGSTELGVDALLDPRMSRRHARLSATEEGLFVEDLGSRNGTLVDGHPVQRAKLRPGALLGLGRVLFQVWRQPAGQRLAGAMDRPSTPPLVAQSPAMWPVQDAIELAAASRAPVLVMGEDGVGKATVARAIHRAGATSGSFVLLPVAAMPPDRVHHALHGHVADPQPMGALLCASGGTLLAPRLDAAQPAVRQALLDFLNDGMIRPTGGLPRPVDVRIIATSVRDLALAAGSGELPVELWRHFEPHAIVVPPLRDRPQDVLPIARSLAIGHAGRVVQLDRLLALLLALHDWPGNVGELDQVIARIVADQPGADVLTNPPWGAETFGPDAHAVISTYDLGTPSLIRAGR